MQKPSTKKPSASKKAPPAERGRRSPSTDPLKALAAMLLGSARKTAPVLLARDAPGEYVRAHGRELKQRGVSSPTSVPPETLVWIALVDAMRRDRRAAEIDWRSPPDEASIELEALRPAIPRAAWTRVASAIADEIPTEEFLQLLARAVKDTDSTLRLARLDRASDSTVVAPIKTSDLPGAAKLIKAAGIGTISDLSGVAASTSTSRARPRRSKASDGNGAVAVRRSARR